MSSLPKNFPNQDWFNRQSYEVLAEITEMLWKTHTINIPEWDKMTEEDVNERCKEWGVERGKNIWHSRWRLRAANDDQSDDEESDQETDQEEEEEEFEETDSEEEEESYLASKRKRDAETGKRLLNQALSRDQDSSDGSIPALELQDICYDPDGWAFGKGCVGNPIEKDWWNELENKFANDEGSLTQDELTDLLWKRGLAGDGEEAQRHPTDMIGEIKRFNDNWIRHKERGGGPLFPGNPQSSYSAWEEEYLGD